MRRIWVYAAAFTGFVAAAELGMTYFRKPPPAPVQVSVPKTPEQIASDDFMKMALGMNTKVFQAREEECARLKKKTGKCAPVPVPLD